MNMKKSFLGVLVLATAVFSQENYSQWLYYKNIVLNTSVSGADVSGNATGFPVLVRLTSANADVFAGSFGKGKDIRFVKANGTTALKYQIERWDSAGQAAEIWVLTDTVYGNNSIQSIRMYWGKNGVADSSKASSVFATAGGWVGVWHMEGDSSNVADATGAGFYGKNYGTTSATGAVGIGRSFVRSSPTVGQYVRIYNSGNNGKFDANMTQTTLSLWVNGTDWGSSATDRAKIICRGTSSFKYELLDTNLGTATNGMWWGVNPTSGNNGSLIKTQASLSTGAWHLIHGTYNISTSTIGLYVDGAFVGSVSGNAAYAVSPWDIHLGSRGSGSTPEPSPGPEDHFFNGMIDEVRMQGIARDSNWIKLDYATQKSGANTVVLGSTVTLPGAPTNVTGVAGNAQVVVSWTAPSSDGGSAITGYRVGTVSDTTKFCTTTGSLTCTITGLTNGIGYSFTVTATNAAGTGTVSSASAVVTPVAPVGVPDAPTSALAIAGNAQVTVSWTAPVSNGGSAITGYTATSSPDGKTCTTTGGLTCVVTGLTNGVAYTFAVTASNISGSSAASAASSAATPVGVPGIPTGVAGAAGNALVVVSWTAPASTGGSVITGYKAMSVSDTTKSCTTTGALNCTVSGLINGTAYTFVVKASNAVGIGAASTASPAVTPVTVPGAPTITSVVGASGQVSVSWAAPVSNGGSTVTGYIATATQDTSKHCSTTGALTCNVTGLTNTTAYTITVVATNAVGKGSASAPSASVTRIGSFTLENGFRVERKASGVLFHLPSGFSDATLEVMDIWGRTVWSSVLSQATRELAWNGQSLSGQPIAGVYLVRLLVKDGNQGWKLGIQTKIVLTP